MARSLKALCYLFTGSVALFVLVNLVAAYLYPHDTRAVLSEHPAFKEAMSATYERIYQLPISVIRETIAECWMENALILAPYVQFRERPRIGQYVNISPDGFRLNAKDGRKTFDLTVKAVFI